MTDITDEVSEAVTESGVGDGIVCVYSPHTTCCVRVNELERGFLEDFAALLKRLVPTEHYYAHDDWDRRTENICQEDMEVGNGHSHCMSMLLGPAGESIPVREGELCLGTWQRSSSSSSTASATAAGSSRSSASDRETPRIARDDRLSACRARSRAAAGAGRRCGERVRATKRGDRRGVLPA